MKRAKKSEVALAITDSARPVIRIRGARTHNLRNVDVDVPIGALTVMTGVSGSGKSSLAINTLFAEGQRRYLESVAPHTRLLLNQLSRPDVDEISGLPPTVSLDQRLTTAPARSTLAVTTEIYDFLRLLYARAGTVHCTRCGQPVISQSVEQIVRQTLGLPERTKLMILSPIVRGRRGGHRDIVERIVRNGFVRARIDGQVVDVAEVEPLNPAQEHSIDVIVDRVVIREGIEQRLRESVELACRESGGSCIISHQNGSLSSDTDWVERLFSTRFSCPGCDLSFPAPEPRSFSFHSAWGACPECRGFGVQGTLERSDDTVVFGRKPCPACHGTRLQPVASRVRFLGATISEFTALDVSSARRRLEDWELLLSQPGTTMRPESELVAKRLLPEIRQRLQCLQQVGIGYLSLDRATRTLSGGEYQRARLAACLGTTLHGACFVLDEPTAGLHPRDTAQLIASLKSIRDRGGTVVVVEHDLDVMQSADWLIDLGPGAGADGGRLLFAGTPKEAVRQADSPTGEYLRNGIHLTPQTLPGAATWWLTIHGAKLNTLADVTVTLPLQRLVAVTGVSGSGKSSLMIDTLLPVAAAACNPDGTVHQALQDARCDRIDGLDRIRRVISLDASPAGRNSRSCVATITGLWNPIRRLLAKTRDARASGYGSQRFSFNSGEGRCPECRGTGIRNLKMSFLPDASIPCPSCHGRRFSRSTLEVRFLGRNAADLLDLRIDEAVTVFAEFSELQPALTALHMVGLGYLTLGQPASTFSGGEAQRVRLATELSSPHPEPTLYILDEPTRGLHPADVKRLIGLLRRLVEAGHSVFVVEHNPDVIRVCDWMVDLGPDSGANGGQIVFSGTLDRALQPDDVASSNLASAPFSGTNHDRSHGPSLTRNALFASDATRRQPASHKKQPPESSTTTDQRRRSR